MEDMQGFQIQGPILQIFYFWLPLCGFSFCYDYIFATSIFAHHFVFLIVFVGIMHHFIFWIILNKNMEGLPVDN